MSGPERRPLRVFATLLGLASLAQPAAAHTPSPLEAEIAHGRALAATNCASCHAVDTLGPSPNHHAPPFRVLSGRYVELTLHRKLTEISETGHYDMPPMPVHTDEVRAIVAYINSLEPPKEPPRTPPKRP